MSIYERISELAEDEICYLEQDHNSDEPNDDEESFEDKSWYFFENQLYIMRQEGSLGSEEESEILSLFDDLEKPMISCYLDVISYCSERSL